MLHKPFKIIEKIKVLALMTYLVELVHPPFVHVVIYRQKSA